MTRTAPGFRFIPGHAPYRAGYMGTIYGRSGKPLAGGVIKGGYRAVKLHSPFRAARVHVLMLETFCGPRPPGEESRHLDNNPGHNHWFNLRWGTRSTNTLDQVKRGTHNASRITHCPSGHSYAEYGRLYTPPDGRTRRECMECNRIYLIGYSERSNELRRIAYQRRKSEGVPS